MHRFESKTRHVTTTQCYAPTETADDIKKDEYLEQVTSTLKTTRKGDIVILMGDFNAKIGGSTIRTHGTTIATGYLNYARQLVISGSIFPHKEIHKYKLPSSSGNTSHQIDHICGK